MRILSIIVIVCTLALFPVTQAKADNFCGGSGTAFYSVGPSTAFFDVSPNLNYFAVPQRAFFAPSYGVNANFVIGEFQRSFTPVFAPRAAVFVPRREEIIIQNRLFGRDRVIIRR